MFQSHSSFRHIQTYVNVVIVGNCVFVCESTPVTHSGLVLVFLLDILSSVRHLLQAYYIAQRVLPLINTTEC